MNQRELRNIILTKWFELGIAFEEHQWDTFVEEQFGTVEMTMPQQERYVKAWNDAIAVFEKALGRCL